MKPKPPCPKCGVATLVKTDCGSTKGIYAYICYAHDDPIQWTQIPPHMLCHSSDSSRVRMKNVKKNASVRIYRCGKCGAPKKGHVCLGSHPPSSDITTVAPPISSTSTPQQPQHDYEDDIEEDEDDMLPPAPPALLQLRPLSEVSQLIMHQPQ